MKRIASVLIVSISIILNTLTASAEEIHLDAESYILADLKSGQIIYEYNADAKRYPASTTKMLTAIIALQNAKPDQLMTASRDAVNDIGKDGMNIGILPDEQLRFEDLVNAMLIRSANETANIIAENVCPTRQQFVDLMNEKASEIGATESHFVNPCGAHNKDHYSTARDLLKNSRYGMSIPKFKEIVAKKDYRMPPTNKHSQWPSLTSTNVMINWKSDYYKEITGVKTGYTDPAGNNLIASAINDSGMELISVVLGVGPKAGTHAVFNFSRQLLEYGFKNYSNVTLIDSDKLVDKVAVDGAKNNTPLEIVTMESLQSVLPNDKSKWNITKNVQINKGIKAPIKAGDKLGYIEYSSNGISLGKVHLAAKNSIEEKKTLPTIIKKTVSNSLLKNIIISSVSLILGFLVLRFSLRRISRRVKAKKHSNV